MWIKQNSLFVDKYARVNQQKTLFFLENIKPTNEYTGIEKMIKYIVSLKSLYNAKKCNFKSN